MARIKQTKQITLFSLWSFNLERNNLYGWAMTQYFPAGEFKWFKHDETKKIWCEYNTKRCSRWFYPEVDLEYPEKLHNFCNDYHLAPEKIETRKNMLSNYCKKSCKPVKYFSCRCQKNIYQTFAMKTNMFFITETCSYI